jgi:hypothetical protein
MQVETEYRLAAYAIAIAIVVLAISGVAIVTGDSPPETMNASQPTDTETTETGRNISVTESEQVDVSVVTANNDTVSFAPNDRTCRGGLRVDDPNRNQTDVELDNVTVTLVADHTAPFDEIERDQFAKLVWSEVSGRAGLAEHDHVEIRVNQYYETVERDEPLDTVGIRVRPVDHCLPVVDGEVSLDNQSVNVRSEYSDLEEIDLTLTDTIGVLNAEERKLVERLIVSDERASYTVQTEFSEPKRLNATVREATNDGTVTLELSSPVQEGRTVVVTIDLHSETVDTLWTKVSLERIEGTDTVTVGNADGNSTVTVDVNTTTPGT